MLILSKNGVFWILDVVSQSLSFEVNHGTIRIKVTQISQKTQYKPNKAILQNY